MVKKLLSLFCVLTLIISLTACGKPKAQKDAGKPRVVSTTAMIQEIVNHIGQDKISSDCLIKGDIDPHSYELVKGDQAKLNAADCIFYQGLGLEHGASLVSYLKTHHQKALAVGEVLRNDSGDQLIYHDGYLDPHVWLDVSLWQKIVPVITQKLIELDPESREIFEKNAEQLLSKMDALDQNIYTLLQEIPENKRYLVTSHSAFSYFTRRYISHEGLWDKRCMAPEGLAPESQISLYDIEKVVAYIAEHGVKVIFSESNVSKDAIAKILDVCKKTGVEVRLAQAPLFGDALFDEKGYLDMMWHNATLIHQAWHEQDINALD